MGRPVLGFVGIHAGRRTDQPVSQDETLAQRFSESGYRVRSTSAIRHRVPRTLHQILSILVWRNVDLLMVSVFSGPSFRIAEFATLLGRLTGKRLVLFLHGGNLPEFTLVARGRVERVLRRADLVVAPSEYLAGSFRKLGFDVRVIPNVLDIDCCTYRENRTPRPALLWMRTFHPHYDPLLAVRVLDRVSEAVPDVVMTMAGADQGILDQVVAEANRRGLSDRITFPGYLRLEEKRAALDEHDIFLNTNVVDNMPVSVLEAASAGLVPVATAVGGIPALLTNGENAVLVPPGDEVAMGDAVIELVADPARFRRLSQHARRLAEASSWPSVQRLWEVELTRLLPGRRLS